MIRRIHTFSSILNKPNVENENIHKLVKDYNFNQHFILEDSIDFLRLT